MVNVKEAAVEIAKMAMLKFFPADKEARNGIVEFICNMATDNAQIAWLVRRVLATCNDWPGPAEIRRIFGTRFRPADGIAVSVCSCGCGKAQTFELAPTQVWPPQLESGDMKRLPAGKPTEAEEAEADRAALAALWADYKPQPHAITAPKRDFREVLMEAQTAQKDRRELPPPTPQIITQADIDAAVAELRAKKSAEEFV